MKSVKEKDIRDFKIKIIKSKMQYITEAMKFTRRMQEEKATDLRKKKKLR